MTWIIGSILTIILIAVIIATKAGWFQFKKKEAKVTTTKKETEVAKKSTVVVEKKQSSFPWKLFWSAVILIVLIIFGISMYQEFWQKPSFSQDSSKASVPRLQEVRLMGVNSQTSSQVDVPIEHSKVRFGCFGEYPCPAYEAQMSMETFVIPAGDTITRRLGATTFVRIRLTNPADPPRDFYVQSWDHTSY